MERLYPTLAKDSERISYDQLRFAPELSSLAALDANLAITMTQLELYYCFPKRTMESQFLTTEEIREQVLETVYVLSESLRGTLATYYSLVRMDCEEERLKAIIQDDIPF